MKTSIYEDIKNILSNLYEERIILQSQIDENNLHIQETQSLNKKMQESKEDDLRIFSPRKNRNQIGEPSNIEIENYVLRNSELIKKIDKLNIFINILENILKADEVDTKNAESHFNIDLDLYTNLEHILHKVELSIQFLRQDPERAKLELLMISETLQRILQNNTEE